MVSTNKTFITQLKLEKNIMYLFLEHRSQKRNTLLRRSLTISNKIIFKQNFAFKKSITIFQWRAVRACMSCVA